jgi:quinol monooxygenase YgiN/HEPN domain-containing protein
MDRNTASASWFKLAEEDLNAAEFLAEHMQPVPAEVICYHCEQSAEKYLKGFLVLNGVIPEKTHDLSELGSACAKFSKSFEDIDDMLTALSEYAVHIRYPSQIEITDDDMKRAIANSRSVEAMTRSLSNVTKGHQKNHQPDWSTNMIKVIAHSYIDPAKTAEAQELLRELISTTRTEDGCLEYRLFAGADAPSNYVITEEWGSKEALDTHMQSEHFTRIIPLLGALSVKPLEVAVYGEVVI